MNLLNASFIYFSVHSLQTGKQIKKFNHIGNRKQGYTCSQQLSETATQSTRSIINAEYAV
jgi:hypothetical protein